MLSELRMRWNIASMRVIYKACLLIACLMSSTTFAQEVDSLRKGVVKLVSTSNEGAQRTGAGFIVRRDAQETYIVTALHVVEGDKSPKVAFHGQPHSWIDAEVLKNDLRTDISLLKIRDNTKVPLNAASLQFLADDDLKDGDELIVIGFSGSVDWARVTVQLASKEGLDLVIDRELHEGFSGGPLIKHNKEVIGLITRTDELGRAIPSDIVRKLIAGWGVGVSLQTTDGNKRSTTPISTKPATETRLPFEPEMVRIPSGKFRMGSPETEAGRNSHEGPQHEVTISKPFALSRHEITVGQFRQFVEDAGYRTTAEKSGKGCYARNADKKEADQLAERNWKNPGFKQSDDHPVVCVSRDDAQKYVTWLSRRTGAAYRLPTEAEWEYAARAGTTAARYYRYDQQCKYANGAGQETKSIAGSNWVLGDCADGYVYTAPVGSFGENHYGLFDMLGNVSEWTQDCWYDEYYDDFYNVPVDGSALLGKDGGNCNFRVVRGGSWGSGPRYLRSASRGTYDADEAVNYLGFRIARAF